MNPTAPLLLGCLTEKENIRLTDHTGLLHGLHTTDDPWPPVSPNRHSLPPPPP